MDGWMDGGMTRRVWFVEKEVCERVREEKRKERGWEVKRGKDKKKRETKKKLRVQHTEQMGRTIQGVSTVVI